MKIGIIGPFGDTNFGDYSMLVNNVYSFGRNHEFTVFTYNMGFLEELRVGYLKECAIRGVVVETSYYNTPKLNDRYNVEYDIYPYTPIEIVDYLVNKQEILDGLSGLDVLVVNGGGFFNHVWAAKHRKAKLFAIMGVILLADRLGLRIFFLGNTFGPFYESERLFSNFFNRLRNVNFATRDNIYSVSWLRNIGIRHDITLLPDDLYFIDSALQKEDNITGLPSKYIVLEIYDSVELIKNNIHILKYAVNALYEEYGLSVVLLPLDKEYGGMIQCELIAREISSVFLVPFSNGKYRKIEEVLTIVKNADFILSQRYHLFVFALANNIPAIQALKTVCGDNSYYYTKGAGALENVLINQRYDEALFLYSDFWKALNSLISDYVKICDSQRKLYNSQKIEQEKIQKAIREKYIFDNILT